MARKLPPVDADLSPLVTDLRDLGHQVRNARAQAQLRIDDAASLSGVSSDFLSRLENGKPVTTDRLLLALEALGLQLLVLPKGRARTYAQKVLADRNQSNE